MRKISKKLDLLLFWRRIAPGPIQVSFNLINLLFLLSFFALGPPKEQPVLSRLTGLLRLGLGLTRAVEIDDFSHGPSWRVEFHLATALF